MSIKIKRGLEGNRLSITPAVGEPLFTTDTKKMYIGDGITPGGVPVDTTGGEGVGVQSVNERTGDVVLSKVDVGLSNVNNTSDANKPVSSAVQAALDKKANLNLLSGVATSGSYADLLNKPTIPAPQVQADWSAANGVAAILNKPNLSVYANASDVTTKLAAKVDKAPGKQLSDQNYTQDEKNKLAGIEAGAEVNTVDSVAGKTGVVTLARDDVGLANVDNTSDANKPVSTATQTALDGKVSKVTTANTLYGVNGSGNQTSYLISQASDTSSIAQRSSGGTLAVGTPTASAHATTKAYVDAADALKLNISDNRVELRGVGFPQGVVSAPVGTTYVDTAATNGAIEWKKVSGSSSTGWVVSVGDISTTISASDLLNGWDYETSFAGMRLARTGNIVTLTIPAVGLRGTSATANIFYAPPAGYRISTAGNYGTVGFVNAGGATAVTRDFNNLACSARTSINGILSWRTAEAWPA